MRVVHVIQVQPGEQQSTEPQNDSARADIADDMRPWRKMVRESSTADVSTLDAMKMLLDKTGRQLDACGRVRRARRSMAHHHEANRMA